MNLSPFPHSTNLHILFIFSPFSRSLAARLQQVVQPCSWVTNYQPTTHENILKGSLPGSFFCISTENTLYTVHMYETWELHNQEVTQVVGILARARKNRLVHYEGETLWQVTLPLLFNNFMETWSHCHSIQYCHSIHSIDVATLSKGQDDEVNVTLLRPIQDITDHNRDTGELLYNREANDLVVLRSFLIWDNAAL